MIYLQDLLQKFDVVFLQETHSSPGKITGWRGVQGGKYFSSHGQHGVGILISDSFRALFDEDPELLQVEPGRLALLRLRGPHGALDLGVWYAQTGYRQYDRSDLRSRLVAHLRPASQVLTILGGDFNHVAQARDRFESTRATWTCHTDTAEEEEFKRIVADPIGLYEIEQPAPTHANAFGRSRLDRMYWNAHLATQLDRTLRSGVLPWIPHLSAHRVMCFSCTASGSSSRASHNIPSFVFKLPDWRRRVALEWHDLLKNDAVPDGALRRILLLKRALQSVSQHMRAEHANEVSDLEPDDCLGITMSYLRAVEDEFYTCSAISSPILYSWLACRCATRGYA